MTGTVTGRIEESRHVAVRHRMAAVVITVAAVLGVLGVAVVGGPASQTVVLLLALGGVLVVARVASIALRVSGGDGPVGAYAWRRRTVELTETSGARHTCHLDGEPVGDPPRRGDVVEVYGRAGHDGTVRVREAVRLEDGAVIGARPAPTVVAARIADATAALIVLTCVVVLVVDGLS
ncbi:hypothetical protein [Pseudonocardia endophytica]|uniref:Uncharacterized protein n=1 Tax=Pseudonocardia endophytica TaxID=401976 RepID=A0A4V2PHX7_PSEEN|nr:hypothetical protein [Pseudonocardia endophytica]TCK22276.1 hypothetical protein EV378_6277 [Pseudonocardia endophytica]